MSELKPLTFPDDSRQPKHPENAFPFSTGKQSGQGNAPVENRMQQLEDMLQQAQSRTEIIEKEAYDKAYLAGEKAGMALGKKRGEQILEVLQSSLKLAENDITALRTSFADAAMDVAGHIAGQILGQDLAENRSTLVEIARQAAAQLPDGTNLHIAVAADDYLTFKRMLDEDGPVTVLRADASIATGSCRIISESQDILVNPVAAVAGYLAQLRPALLEPRTADKHDAHD